MQKKDTVESVHKSVLLNETIEGLHLSSDMIVLDGTFGGGGHSVEICKRYRNIKIIAIDQDKGAWSKAENKFKDLDCDITFINTNFRDIDKALDEVGIDQVDGFVLDLGLSSDQLENAGRGFSFMKDEPLLMTMKDNPTDEDITAIDIVNTWDEKNIADIIYGYGEEKFSRRIARAIVETREIKEIKTTFDLVSILEDCLPGVYKRGRLHYATRTFQALRMAVNDELNTLELGLRKGYDVLKNGGRMSVISFHSLEDRIVKNFYKVKKDSGEGILINKKPIIASSVELKNNPRARSAKLRIIEKNK
ncbi:MAG: 16S rRNA (cytosine(1402)-N(4))-methyltransferase RsmH [bacterium]|nr:16S rRNA (cytosine(1402)-N(4))-methyltransferase RsmH [bacterium]